MEGLDLWRADRCSISRRLRNYACSPGASLPFLSGTR